MIQAFFENDSTGPVRTDRPRSRPRMATLAAIGLAGVLVPLAGCGGGGHRTNRGCELYLGVISDLDRLFVADPGEQSVGQFAAVVDQALVDVGALRQAGGRAFGAPANQLEQALTGLAEVLSGVDPSATSDEWAPLLEEPLQAIDDAAVPLDDAAAQECTSS